MTDRGLIMDMGDLQIQVRSVVAEKSRKKRKKAEKSRKKRKKAEKRRKKQKKNSIRQQRAELCSTTSPERMWPLPMVWFLFLFHAVVE